MDPRYQELAKNLTNFSMQLKANENVLIDARDVPEQIVIALIQAARACKAIPFVLTKNSSITRELIKGSSENEYDQWNEFELDIMKKMDAYVAIRGSHNIFEFSDVPGDKMKGFMKAMKPTQDWRVNKTKWVVLRWPNPSFAQQSKMSTEAFEDFYFKVCTLDYSRMIPGMNALKTLMEKTDKVHITGPATDLKFSIKGIPAITCGGQFNIPDGEVFTAPIKNSVNGYITYNVPSIYEGFGFDNIRFEFKEGKIIDATSNNTDRINKILDGDEGARYIGEFAIGFNPYILEPMNDILFDEKISGSFHFTPGQAYEIADNGNKSQVHWDLVSIQRSDYGGGEIKFDGEVIRKDGLFLPSELQKLNPDYLLKKEAKEA